MTGDGKGRSGDPGADAGNERGPGRVKACPTCGKPATREHRPFCSRRCADIDLGRWFRGDYRVPAVEPPDGTTEEPGGGEGGTPSG
ncbi:MAG TPA: DNA gyrase inhibitor YacG [Alphaproteobacteria bacterium]|jgi:hypothetical protein